MKILILKILDCRPPKAAAFLVLLLWLVSSPAASKGGPPAPARNYLFYLHGAWPELHGLNQAHPKHGFYQYHEIVGALAGQGYEVRSELREKEVHHEEYAKRIAGQVRSLLAGGVPARHIIIAGHSKGGQMALIAAGLLREADLNYVVMAGCGKSGTLFRRSYEKFLKRYAGTLRGRILSIYDEADREAGSCREAFHQGDGLETKEAVLRTGQGHGLFYAPQSVWLRMINEWVSR